MSEQEQSLPPQADQESPEQAPQPVVAAEEGVEPEDEQAHEQTVREVSQTELPRIVEALLFATDEPLTLQKIKSILPDKIDIRRIKAAIDDTNRRLSAEHHPYEIVEVAGGYQFRTVQYYHPWVRQLFRDKISRRLSQSALETLAIVAYKQPLTKAEIEAIRGVMADGAMKTLLERRLIRINGRSEKPGRPLLYETTKDFLRYFGLKHIDDLPKLEEFEQLVKAQAENAPAEKPIEQPVPEVSATGDAWARTDETKSGDETAAETENEVDPDDLLLESDEEEEPHKPDEEQTN